MPSQEEYLDSLLRNFDMEKIQADMDVEQEPEQGPGQEPELPSEELPAPEPDLMSLLEGSEDEDLQEIQALLQKEENGESLIDEDAELIEEKKVPEELFREEDPLQEEDPDQTVVDKAAQKAQKIEEKKRIRLEKKEARRQAREAKKAERDAAKEQKRRKRTETEKQEEPEEPVESAIDADPIPKEIADEMDLFMGIAEKDEILPVAGPETEEDALEQIKEKEKVKEKKSFFAKLLDLLTEEDDEEEEQGNEAIRLSEENQAILEELDREKGGKKAKKSKKKKKEKTAVDGDGAVGEADEIPEKGKKPQKPKKEKKKREKPAPEAVDENPGKKLSLKKIFPIIAVCASGLAVLLIVSNLMGDYSSKREGRKAYYEGDYQTCYQNLYGKTLNESEQVMYSKSESILRIQLWMREYEILEEEGDRVKALDSLIQSVKDYPKLYAYASEWNAGEDVSAVYHRMLTILADEYGLTEEQAAEIAAEPDDIVYTRRVTAIAGGEGFEENESAPSRVPEEPLTDVLPEEEGIDGTVFIDNNR